MKSCHLIRIVLAALVSFLVLPPTSSAASRTAHHKASTTHLKSSKSSAKSSGRVSSTSTRRRGSRGGKLVKASEKSAEPTVKRSRGQQGIDSDRAREIQSALIREHYLNGEPSGVWDSQTRDAMVRFQGDNGWQTKVTPDSRALIKLGLGPSREGLLNPDSADVASPVSQLGINRDNPNGMIQR